LRGKRTTRLRVDIQLFSNNLFSVDNPNLAFLDTGFRRYGGKYHFLLFICGFDPCSSQGHAFEF
jgi:hypothetical protein